MAARGRFEEATAHYRKALENRPDYPNASYNLGIALAGCGQFDEAFAYLQPALKLRPNDAELQSTLGNILAARGQFQDAVAHYRKALEIRPDDLAAQKNLAWLRATCPVASQRNGGEAWSLPSGRIGVVTANGPTCWIRWRPPMRRSAGFRRPWPRKAKPWSLPRNRTPLPRQTPCGREWPCTKLEAISSAAAGFLAA